MKAKTFFFLIVFLMFTQPIWTADQSKTSSKSNKTADGSSKKTQELTANVFRITPRNGVRHLDLSTHWEFFPLDHWPNSPEQAVSEKKYKMARPMSVAKALFYAGFDDDPYLSKNSERYEWIHQKSWCFQKTFEVRSEWKDGYLFLSFDGLDYHSTVWLNGHQLGNHEGMFGGPEFEISKYLIWNGSNSLTVFLDSAKKREPHIKGFQIGKAIKPWGTSGGDNAEPFISFGLWRGVRLDAMPKIHLERPYLVTKKVSSDKAVVRFETEILANKHSFEFNLYPAKNRQLINLSNASPLRTKISGNYKIRITFQNRSKTSVHEYPFDLYENRNWFRTDLTIDQPDLWYPNQLGKQPIYQVAVELLQNQKIIDKIELPFGLRTVHWEDTPGPKLADRWGSWQCVVNGKKFMIKGINWIPIDALFDLPLEKYRWYLQMAKDAGIQLIRIWGAGLQEAEEFYSLCDELGLMVWQDFPIANADAGLWDHIPWESQIMTTILRLRNRTSLVVWCGGNEFNPYCRGNTPLIGIIERNLQIFDPSRKFVRTSPDEGSFHTYPDMDPTWYKKNYKEYPALTESGIHSVSSVRSMLGGLINPKELQFIDKMYLDEYKKLCPESVHHFVEYIPRRIPRMLSRASHIVKIKGITFEDMALGSQLGAGEFYQIFSEGMLGNYPITSVQLPWVFARTWPVISGVQLVDGSGQPVAPYYFLKRTYEPIHVSLDLDRILWKPGEQFPIATKILNLSDSSDGKGTLTVVILDEQFREMYHQENEVVWQQSPSVLAEKHPYWTIPADYRYRFFFIVAELKNKGHLISRSVYWPRTIPQMDSPDFYQKYVSAPCFWPEIKNGPFLKEILQKAPKAQLTLNIISKKSRRDGQYRITDYLLNISNTGTVPSPVTWIDLKETTPKFYAGDNFFWIAPGEKKNVPLKVRENWSEKPSVQTIQLKTFHNYMIQTESF